MRAFALAIVLAALGMPSAGAVAQEFNLAIRNHKFEPQEIRVPAGKRVSIYVTNEDPTPRGIRERDAQGREDHSRQVQKAWCASDRSPPGRYEFIGDFHADTAKGVVIAE